MHLNHNWNTKRGPVPKHWRNGQRRTHFEAPVSKISRAHTSLD